MISPGCTDLISPVFRDDLAHHPDLMSPGREGVLAVWFLALAKPRGQSSIAARRAGLLLLLWACGQRTSRCPSAAACPQRRPSGRVYGFAVEIHAVGVMGQEVEDGVRKGRIAEHCRALHPRSGGVPNRGYGPATLLFGSKLAALPERSARGPTYIVVQLSDGRRRSIRVSCR